MSAEEATKLIQTLLDHPSVKKMAELDIWGRDQGIESEARSRIVRDVSSFLVSTSTVELGKEYVHKLVEVIANLGPELIQTMRSTTQISEKGG